MTRIQVKYTELMSYTVHFLCLKKSGEVITVLVPYCYYTYLRLFKMMKRCHSSETLAGILFFSNLCSYTVKTETPLDLTFDWAYWKKEK